MKKLICFSVLAVTLILLSNHKATAQCGQTGSSYYCSAYSFYGQDRITEYAQWASNSSGFTISVTLQIYDETDPYRDAFASVLFGGYGWSRGINEGYYEDSFYASGSQSENISLFTTVKAGSAIIVAEW
jgi:hypothetical protein